MAVAGGYGGAQAPPGNSRHRYQGRRCPRGPGSRLSGLVTFLWTRSSPPVAPVHAVGALADSDGITLQGIPDKAGFVQDGQWWLGVGRYGNRLELDVLHTHPGTRGWMLPSGVVRCLGSAGGARGPPRVVGHPGANSGPSIMARDTSTRFSPLSLGPRRCVMTCSVPAGGYSPRISVLPSASTPTASALFCSPYWTRPTEWQRGGPGRHKLG